MNGKGDKPRPSAIGRKKWTSNWAKIYAKTKPQKRRRVDNEHTKSQLRSKQANAKR